MDKLEFDGYRQLLQMAKAAHEGGRFESSEALQQSLKNIREAKEMVDDFIEPKLDIDDSWEEAHKAIAEVWYAQKPQKVEVLLPVFVSSQSGKRQRVETQDFWVFRPVFRHYEEQTTRQKTQGLYALTGPQGSGKSVFLHCLALKCAFSEPNLVVWVASCPPTVSGFKTQLADAFYRGCQARGLDGIPYLKLSDSIIDSLHAIENFATEKGALLFVIIDQLHRKLDYFEELTGSLISVLATGVGHRVIVSSSTSGTTEQVFPDYYIPLPVFDHFLSDGEIDI